MEGFFDNSDVLTFLAEWCTSWPYIIIFMQFYSFLLLGDTNKNAEGDRWAGFPLGLTNIPAIQAVWTAVLCHTGDTALSARLEAEKIK
jgi:hypothetical protein